MSGWANNDNYGQDPRFGNYYGQGYSGFGRQGYLGYYGGRSAGNAPYPGDALGESGYYGTDEAGYPFYGSGYGLPPRAPAGAAMPQGPHAGKGPKRSDDWIDDEVRRRLTENGHLDASQVDVSVQHGEVALSGTVDSRYAKRTAEDIAESVPGVRDIHNRLTIQQQGQGPGQPQAPQRATQPARQAQPAGTTATAPAANGETTSATGSATTRTRGRSRAKTAPTSDTTPSA